MINTALNSQLDLFDLEQRAENGLRRGYTTGSSATAAVKVAVWMFLTGDELSEVEIALPDRKHYLVISVNEVTFDKENQCTYASIIKDGGDDPDKTHKAKIWAKIRVNKLGEHRFLQGRGVGIIQSQGLAYCVGEPAINPVPRAMILQEVEDCLQLASPHKQLHFDIEIGCVNGEEIAKKTFNPRLGIVGGISILGTSGIVEPKSLKAFLASIEVYVKVALADNAKEIVFSPGNIGQRFARESLLLSPKRIVQTSNFIGDSLLYLDSVLSKEKLSLDRLWIVGHPGKVAKILNGDWNTHSKNSPTAVSAVLPYLLPLIKTESLRKDLQTSKTVESIIQKIVSEPQAAKGWSNIENAIEQAVRKKFGFEQVQDIKVRLFRMNGSALVDEGSVTQGS